MEVPESDRLISPFGSMILSYVEPFDDLAFALRVALQLGGKAFLYENGARNQLLMLSRRHEVGQLRVPNHGDAEEFPSRLRKKMLPKHLSVEVSCPELVLFRLVSAYLPRVRGGRPLHRLDDLLYRVPSLRRCGYQQYVLWTEFAL